MILSLFNKQKSERNFLFSGYLKVQKNHHLKNAMNRGI